MYLRQGIFGRVLGARYLTRRSFVVQQYAPSYHFTLTTSKLDAAFAQLAHNRRHHPASADIWNLRRFWPLEKSEIKAALATGSYRFSPLSRVTLKSGEVIDVWGGFDFLGYHFTCDDNNSAQLTLARQTVTNFQEKLSRLYEQRRHCPPQWRDALEAKITTYIYRFTGWAYGDFQYALSTLVVYMPGGCSDHGNGAPAA